MDAKDLHPMEHLSKIDIGAVMRAIEVDEAARVQAGHGRRYGLIPLMAECYLHKRGSSSFVERVNSHGKLILGERRPCLSDSELEWLCVLRVNRKFMEYMYANHWQLLEEAQQQQRARKPCHRGPCMCSKHQPQPE